MILLSFHRLMPVVCVFCGSRDGNRPDYQTAATQLGHEIAGAGLDLIYGGARSGLMGRVADASLAAGGRVIGVLPERLIEWEVAHPNLTELIEVESMMMRKEYMLRHSDAFISLPGGIGTLDELLEVMTLNQLRYFEKPNLLLNIANYYQPLLDFLEHAIQQGFYQSEHRAQLQIASDVPEVMHRLRRLLLIDGK